MKAREWIADALRVLAERVERVDLGKPKDFLGIHLERTVGPTAAGAWRANLIDEHGEVGLITYGPTPEAALLRLAQNASPWFRRRYPKA